MREILREYSISPSRENELRLRSEAKRAGYTRVRFKKRRDVRYLSKILKLEEIPYFFLDKDLYAKTKTLRRVSWWVRTRRRFQFSQNAQRGMIQNILREGKTHETTK